MTGPIIFHHIPKAAGTALVDALMDGFLPWHVAFCYSHRQRSRLDRLNDEQWSRMRLVCGHQTLGLAESRAIASFQFTMVRDPVAHFLSMYQYKARQGEMPYARVPFPVFLAELQSGRIDIDEFGQMIDNIQVRYLNLATHEWSSDPARNSHQLDPDLNEALEWIGERLGFVGVTERFEESLAVLGGHLNRPLVRLSSNAAPSNDRIEMSANDQGFVREYHSLDCRLLEAANKRLDADVANTRSVPPVRGWTSWRRWRGRVWRVLRQA